MPFTFAHPAAVLPLRRYGDLSALVIGSMVPDTGYLLMLELPRELTHGLPALLMFCLPAGLIAYLLYHRVLREPFLALAPAGVRLRLVEHSALPASWRGWMRVAMSLLIGAATHIVWDDLTQLHHWIESMLPGTAGTWFRIRSRDVGWHAVLRHGSGLIGLGVLAMWALREYRSAKPRWEPSGDRLPWATHVLLVVVLGGAVLVLAAVVATVEPDMYGGIGPLGRGARIAVGLLAAALLIYALCWRAWRHWRR